MENDRKLIALIWAARSAFEGIEAILDSDDPRDAAYDQLAALSGALEDALQPFADVQIDPLSDPLADCHSDCFKTDHHGALCPNNPRA